MAVPEEYQKRVLAEATSATPNYEVDYNDERFQAVNDAYQDDLTNLEQTYDNIIGDTDGFYNDLKEETQKWADKQAQIQQDNTDFAIEKIEQQKEQAEKDYIKEQSGAYVDWQKQSNQYGTAAEKMASAGLTNTGYSESSQVSMYNTYQNRVATAREVLSQAKLNYDNGIKDAMLQNNAALAEIYANAYIKQAELALEGFQYKNQLLIDLANKKTELKNTQWNRYQDVLQQINTENALAENIRQYNETQKWETEQAELNRNFQAQQAEIQRKFDAAEAELARKHDKDMLEAKTQKEKELLEQQHKNDLAKLKKQQEYEMAQLNKKLENDKALLKYQSDLAKTKITGSTGAVKVTNNKSSASANTSKISNAIPTKASSTSGFVGKTYAQASAYLKAYGITVGSLMTENEWARYKNNYARTGQAPQEVKRFADYKSYIQNYVKYRLEQAKGV